MSTIYTNDEMFEIVSNAMIGESANPLLNNQLDAFLNTLETDAQYDQLGEILVSTFHLSQQLIRERLLSWRRIPDEDIDERVRIPKDKKSLRQSKEEKAKAFLAKYITGVK